MKLEDKIEIIPRKKLGDDRGWLLKVIDGKENHLPDHTGEVYLTFASDKGKVRGNHYHVKAKEWFTVLQGHAEMRMKDMETGETMTLQLYADEPTTVYLPANIAHAFVNPEDYPFLMLAYTDELYDPSDTIPYSLDWDA